MKSVLRSAALLLLAVACTSRHNEQLSQQQQDQIKGEVRVVADSLMAHFVRNDAAGGFQFYANTPHWVMFNADGTQWDYQTTARLMTDSTNALASYRYTTLHQDFWVVNRDLVLCAWIVRDESVMRSGDTSTYEQHPYTLVFQRLGGQWKVLWSQDSGIPVIRKATSAGHRPR